MNVENTDLERRVLAHEQILQVLIAHMAEAEPKFLDRLQQIFTKHHTLGDEQDYTGTAAFAEQFIRHVIRLRDRQRRGENSPVGKGQPGAPDEMACPVGGHQLGAPDRVIGVRGTPRPINQHRRRSLTIEPGGVV